MWCVLDVCIPIFYFWENRPLCMRTTRLLGPKHRGQLEISFPRSPGLRTYILFCINPPVSLKKVSTLRTWNWAKAAQGPGMLVFFSSNPLMLESSTGGLLSCSWTGLNWNENLCKWKQCNTKLSVCMYKTELKQKTKNKSGLRYQPLSLRRSKTTGQSSWLPGTQEQRKFHVPFPRIVSNATVIQG